MEVCCALCLSSDELDEDESEDVDELDAEDEVYSDYSEDEFMSINDMM
jgi:hypothetical protein